MCSAVQMHKSHGSAKRSVDHPKCFTLTQRRVLKEMLEGTTNCFGLFTGDGQMNASSIDHHVTRFGSGR